jgi:hypothetical protein
MTPNNSGRAVLHPADLSLLERTYLGVLDTGMVPAKLAGDPSLRMDYVTAVCLALREGRERDAYLDASRAEPTAEFIEDLTTAAQSLDAKGVISVGPPPPDLILTPDMPRPPAPRSIDFDQHPRIWDRYLAHTCLEELFSDRRVYTFLMGKYQDSGDVWARLYKERPERFL